jgi:hydroxyacylglutathione hydrolase
MQQVAKNVWMLSGFLPRLFNAYLVEDVLIDALTRWGAPHLFRQLHGRPVSLVALTHCHPDHQGAARVVCEQFGVPLACHEADVDVMEGRRPMLPDNRIIRWLDRMLSGPTRKVDRVLQDGDMVGGFRVVHTPGHTPGHVIFFRPTDRVAIVGDLLHNASLPTGRVGLHETPALFSADPVQNQQSVRLLLALRPSLVCFSHGPPLRRLEVLEQFVARRRSGPGSRWRLNPSWPDRAPAGPAGPAPRADTAWPQSR